MYTVYALYSERHQKIYVGFTSGLEKRILSHNKLATKGWTFRFRPWELVHTECFESKAEAIRREKSLKSARGREFIWGLIRGDAT